MLDSKPIGQINKDETVRIAEEAGFYGFDGDNNKRLLEFANKVAAAEREACAKLLETVDLGPLKEHPQMQFFIADLLLAYAEAIRARGQA